MPERASTVAIEPQVAGRPVAAVAVMLQLAAAVVAVAAEVAAAAAAVAALQWLY